MRCGEDWKGRVRRGAGRRIRKRRRRRDEGRVEKEG